MNFEDVAAIPTPLLREILPGFISGRVGEGRVGGGSVGGGEIEEAKRRVAAAIGTLSDDELEGLKRAFVAAGDEWRLYPAVPAARVISRAFIGFLAEEHRVEGLPSLRRFLSEGPPRRMIVCNHLSYTDTQVTDAVLSGKELSAEGLRDVADRLVAIAGPKVYTETWRRLAAIGLNTRKTVQSSQVATEQDALPPRELARIARETIDDAARMMDEGKIILLYPEGTRSKDGRLQPFLRASHRYTTLPELQILPMVQTGTAEMYPRDSEKMYRVPVTLSFGVPLIAGDFSGKTASLEATWRAMVGLLPEGMRPLDGVAVE